MSIIVGIDLGTSTSEIAYNKDGKPNIILNEYGEKITPSAVSIDLDGSIIVGKEAKSRALLYPKDTIMEVKRLMGTDEKITLNGTEYTPEEVSAKIIRHLIEYAEKDLGQPIDKAVITVPAYFNEQQRRATVNAGKIAGIEVERVINEPTAAALTYGIEHMNSEEHILVYDLGGGTFDVTLLEMFNGVLEVKASSGNNQLGGKDFDQKIINYILEKFLAKNEIDLSTDTGAMVKIKDEAEKCKIALSSQDSYRISIPFIAEKQGNPLEIDEEVTRDIFETIISEMILSTKEAINVVLKDSNVKKEDIDLILLVGGSTRIPMVKHFVEDYFGQEPKQLVDPDLAVAEGAAIQAAILNDEYNVEDGILITDVSPYALGVATAEPMYGFLQTDVMDILIKRNTTIPVSVEKIYTTLVDNQDVAEIKVYQGEARTASHNNFLGEFILQGIPMNNAGKERIKVRFSYNANGMLEVEATILSTGEKAEIKIDMMQIDKSKILNIEEWINAPKAKKYRMIIRKAERKLNNGFLEPEDRIMLEGLVEDIKYAILNDEDDETIDDLQEELFDYLKELRNE